MSSYRLLCVKQDNFPPIPWLDALRRSFPNVVEMTPLYVLQARSLANYDIVIVDAVCALDDVVELCTEIRRRSANPLLAMVPSADEALLLELYCLGVSECITQTRHSSLVVAKVEAWIRWSNTSGPTQQPRFM